MIRSEGKRDGKGMKRAVENKEMGNGAEEFLVFSRARYASALCTMALSACRPMSIRHN